jgi:hypothetical protein
MLLTIHASTLKMNSQMLNHRISLNTTKIYNLIRIIFWNHTENQYLKMIN